MASIRSEGELLTLFAQHMADAEKCMQALATFREDTQYLQVADLIHGVRKKALTVANMKANGRAERSRLILPS